MNLPITWVCPHCGHENKRYVGCDSAESASLVYCDSDTGGCDNQIVLKVAFSARVRALKIEGSL